MTKHLEEIREICYLKIGIINLIEVIDKEKTYKRPLNEVRRYLFDLVEGIYGNIDKDHCDKAIEFFKKELEDKDNGNY